MKTTTTRRPAVAGTFYPEDGAELHAIVSRCLREGHAADHTPRAVIAPHAGFMYSGPIAGSAFAAWSACRGAIARVVVIGPSHRLHFKGIALPETEYFATPLGLIPVDESARHSLNDLPAVQPLDAAHRHEHSIETHLPFLQEVLGEFALVPLVVGDASVRDVAQVINRFINDDATLISVSSDLSHYLSYDEARATDAATSQAIEQNHPHDIGPQHACGRMGILALLHVAARHGLTARTLDVRNSGDTSGDRSRVVGYGAYAFG